MMGNSLALRAPERVNLPATYQAAKQALATCEQLDECKNWHDKAAALAAYGKQANDDSLIIMAQRIQARAIRRCGELLQEIPERRGKNVPAVRALTRSAIAKGAGLTTHQRITATRVASLPKATFEEAVEAKKPATVTELANAGRRRGRPPKSCPRCPTCGRPL